MPSFTSNSNSRIPHAPYKKLWLCSLTLVLVALVASEFFWRQRTFLPTVVDSQLYWGLKRAQVYKKSPEDKRKLVILGASRAQVGLVPEVFEEEFPAYSILHLALEGTNPFWILKDLAEDPEFDGILVCGMAANWIMPSVAEASRPWVEYYYEHVGKLSNIDKKLNTLLQARLQGRSVLFSPQLTLQHLFKTGFSPRPLYAHMRLDRYRPTYYYARMTPEELQAHKEWRIQKATRAFKEASNTEKAQALFEEVVKNQLQQFNTLMRDKGGRIILVRMPTTDEHWRYSQEVFPKEVFWDKIAEWSHLDTIHFYDFEELSTFDCPDTSHLDATDAPEFTRRLSNQIKNLIDPPAPSLTTTVK